MRDVSLAIALLMASGDGGPTPARQVQPELPQSTRALLSKTGLQWSTCKELARTLCGSGIVLESSKAGNTTFTVRGMRGNLLLDAGGNVTSISCGRAKARCTAPMPAGRAAGAILTLAAVCERGEGRPASGAWTMDTADGARYAWNTPEDGAWSGDSIMTLNVLGEPDEDGAQEFTHALYGGVHQESDARGKTTRTYERDGWRIREHAETTPEGSVWRRTKEKDGRVVSEEIHGDVVRHSAEKNKRGMTIFRQDGSAWMQQTEDGNWTVRGVGGDPIGRIDATGREDLAAHQALRGLQGAGSTVSVLRRDGSVLPTFREAAGGESRMTPERYLALLAGELDTPEQLDLFLRLHWDYRASDHPERTADPAARGSSPESILKRQWKGNCADMAMFTADILRRQGKRAYAIGFDSAGGEVGHAVCAWMEQDASGRFHAYTLDTGDFLVQNGRRATELDADGRQGFATAAQAALSVSRYWESRGFTLNADFSLCQELRPKGDGQERRNFRASQLDPALPPEPSPETPPPIATLNAMQRNVETAAGAFGLAMAAGAGILAAGLRRRE